ncbi:NAD kinase [Gregarina niphandrodes]|uniref:NAD kinase n=1 Tax=Gregarina niphandrodes TaxID=110365 RepID=A0A023BAR7_GRENI|nr:NAD kinase [Gregarina niphandrodes]EZG78494.1 NAD kinase [Gregarina niphandrodes]|eukprot:XP_011129278.1 NAD kinase [Gregarina niphandrodes]
MLSPKNCPENTYSFPHIPHNVLLIKRIKSNNVTAISCVLSLWLTEQYDCKVFVEKEALGDFDAMGCHVNRPWQQEKIDLVISLGGDGTTLWASSLFDDRPVPPIMGVTLGSLSYINQFSADELLTTLAHLFESKQCNVQMRSRLFITIYGHEADALYYGHCVNECTIDRGPAANMANLDIYINNRFFTSMSADGLIIATPTGSTAYSMSAGGAVVHPGVSCILFTPICPHSLSMRPLVLPADVEIRIKVPDDARQSVWLSLDGHEKHEVLPGHHVVAAVSANPMPRKLNTNINIDICTDSYSPCRMQTRRSMAGEPYGQSSLGA